MNQVLIFQNIGAPEIIIIALVILLLFGGKKIPELMKGIGKGVKSFKQGVNDVEEEISTAVDDATKEKPAEEKKAVKAPAGKTK